MNSRITRIGVTIFLVDLFSVVSEGIRIRYGLIEFHLKKSGKMPEYASQAKKLMDGAAGVDVQFNFLNDCNQ